MHSAGLGNIAFQIGQFIYKRSQGSIMVNNFDGKQYISSDGNYTPTGYRMWWKTSNTVDKTTYGDWVPDWVETHSFGGIVHTTSTLPSWEGHAPSFPSVGDTYRTTHNYNKEGPDDKGFYTYDYKTTTYTYMENARWDSSIPNYKQTTSYYWHDTNTIDWQAWIPNGSLNSLTLYDNGILFFIDDQLNKNGNYVRIGNGETNYSSGQFMSAYLPNSNEQKTFAEPVIRYGTIPDSILTGDGYTILVHKKWDDDSSSNKVGIVYLDSVDGCTISGSNHNSSGQSFNGEGPFRVWQASYLELRKRASTNIVKMNSSYDIGVPNSGRIINLNNGTRTSISNKLTHWTCYEQKTSYAYDYHDCVFIFYPFGI